MRGRKLHLSIIFTALLAQTNIPQVMSFSLVSFTVPKQRESSENNKISKNDQFPLMNALDSAVTHDNAIMPNDSGEPNKKNIRQTYTTVGTPYHDKSNYKSFENTLKEVLIRFPLRDKRASEEDKKVVFDHLFTSERIVCVNIPVLHDSFINANSCSINEDEMKTKFQSQMNDQRLSFIDTCKLTDHQLNFALRVLTYFGDYCAKKSFHKPLHIAWDKMKEMGIVPPKNVLSTFLYSFSLEADCESSSFNADDNNYNPTHMKEEVATLHDVMYEPSENTISLRIKALVRKGNAVAAERLITNLSTMLPSKKRKKKKDSELKMRTCQPLFEFYCEQNDISSALSLYDLMKKSPSVYFDAETYTMFISAAAENGYFRFDSEPIDGAIDIGYSHGFGPDLLDQLLSDISADILEITNACVNRIRNSITVGFHGLDMAKNLSKIPYDCQLAPVTNIATNGELVASRVTVNNTSGSCPRTNVKLKLITLEKKHRDQIKETLLKMAGDQYEAFTLKLGKAKKKELDQDFAKNELRKFLKWMDCREGKPFTVVVDGANVAYFRADGGFNYHQLRQMVRALENLGEKVLVVIPQKYTQNKFFINNRKVQKLTKPQMDIIDEFSSKEQLYSVPLGCLDDYYWMMSSVSDQKSSSNGVSLEVSQCNEEGRWPGSRPVIITNDLMRDHKLELLEPRLFRRWTSCHIVNYNIPGFAINMDDDREIIFSPAPIFSREVQANPSIIGDSCSTVWHIPVSDWDRNDRFCLMIPRST